MKDGILHRVMDVLEHAVNSSNLSSDNEDWYKETLMELDELMVAVPDLEHLTNITGKANSLGAHTILTLHETKQVMYIARQLQNAVKETGE